MNDEQNNNKPFLINNYPTKNEDLNAPTPINQEDNHININQNHINKYGYFTLNPNFYMFLENQQKINFRTNFEIITKRHSLKFHINNYTYSFCSFHLYFSHFFCIFRINDYNFLSKFLLLLL